MENIVPRHGVITCPNCSNLVSSHSPVCSECDWQASELTVIELAALEERNRQALSAAEDLFFYATVAVVYIFLAFLIGAIFVPGIASDQIFVSVVAMSLFWCRYILWGRRYGQDKFPDEVFRKAVDTRGRTLMIGIALTGVVLGAIYWTTR